MLLLLLLSFFFVIFFTLSLLLAYRKLKFNINRKRGRDIQPEPSALNCLSLNSDDRERRNDPTRLTESLLLEILPSKSAKWESLFGEGRCEDPDRDGSGHEKESEGDEDKRVSGNNKRKKKRAKKKRLESKGEEENGGAEKCTEREREGPDSGRVKPELICLYPFTSTSSATQRKIKQQYDQLVKCHENKGLTLSQVGEFANCLIEARHELQHKSEVIKRKFTITKALLFKADRSSFDRLRQQIYKLEMEQKRLEEDAFVYNWLQQQLKLSPAYKKMVEISAGMELKAKSAADLVEESTDSDEFADISFEELLAQEKKDSFWQKNGRSRLSSS